MIEIAFFETYDAIIAPQIFAVLQVSKNAIPITEFYSSGRVLQFLMHFSKSSDF